MDTLVLVLTWLGLVALGLAGTAGVVVAVLAWFLNHPVDDDDVHQRARRC